MRISSTALLSLTAAAICAATITRGHDSAAVTTSPAEVVNSIGMRLVPIPTGTFMMGAGSLLVEEVRLVKDTNIIVDIQ